MNGTGHPFVFQKGSHFIAPWGSNRILMIHMLRIGWAVRDNQTQTAQGLSVGLSNANARFCPPFEMFEFDLQNGCLQRIEPAIDSQGLMMVPNPGAVLGTIMRPWESIAGSIRKVS